MIKAETNKLSTAVDLMNHPTYFKIFCQIDKGKKTSTSIADALGMAQSGIYERLKKLKDNNFLISDEKNFEIDFDNIAVNLSNNLPMSFKPKVNNETIILLFKKELNNKNNNCLGDAVINTIKKL